MQLLIRLRSAPSALGATQAARLNGASRFAPFLAILALFSAPALAQNGQQPVSRGEYLAHLGDCTSCHTASGDKPFAGGFKVNSPFGAIYGTNITPDPEYGIGNYTLADFTRAVRQGIAKDGHHLYPAMPYPSFAKLSDEDIKALYDYFMHDVPPVHEPSPQTKLPFPFNQRWGIRFWDWLFTKDKRYKPDPAQNTMWNRGAYLVQSLGHCSACHTPRGIAYQEKTTKEGRSQFLHGETLDHWFAANLSADPASGLGRWTEEDIAAFLKTGYGHGTLAFGSMQQVVENSTQYLSPEDSAAIAHYLKSLAAGGEEASYTSNTALSSFERPGAGLYANFCASCHQAGGAGKLPRIPALAGNSAALSDDPISVIRIVLEGSVSPQTTKGPKPAKMPGFAKRFTDREIADVVTFIRQSWGNHATPVTEQEVNQLRQTLAKQPDESTPAKSPPTRQ